MRKKLFTVRILYMLCFYVKSFSGHDLFRKAFWAFICLFSIFIQVRNYYPLLTTETEHNRLRSLVRDGSTRYQCPFSPAAWKLCRGHRLHNSIWEPWWDVFRHFYFFLKLYLIYFYNESVLFI